MAFANVHLHLQPSDAPLVERLPSGSLVIWTEAQHQGPAISGSDESLAKLRDAIGAFLEQHTNAEAA